MATEKESGKASSEKREDEDDIAKTDDWSIGRLSNFNEGQGGGIHAVLNKLPLATSCFLLSAFRFHFSAYFLQCGQRDSRLSPNKVISK